MTERRLLCGYCVFFLVMIVVFLRCGKAEAGEGDDLIAKLRSADTTGHSAATDELVKAADDRLVGALMKIVEERRDDWELQISAIRLLGKIGNPKATGVLIKVVTDGLFTNECPALKWNGIVALGNFKNDPLVVDALLYRLNEDTLYLKEAVIQSLGRIGDRETLPYLISALQDKHFSVRMSAVRALGRMKDPLAVEPLRKTAKSDADAMVRDEALKVLGLLR